MRSFQALKVERVSREIGGQASSVVFEVPHELKDVFCWRPGQHITLRFLLKGEEVRRSYSISSSPYSSEGLRITVKRVTGGLVSNHINDVIAAGDRVEVMPPFGRFVVEPNAKQQKTYYFFAAGSGVTPLFSMLSSVLAAEPYSVCHLLYGNKSFKTCLFKDRLEELQGEYSKRLSVHHVLSDSSVWDSEYPWKTGKITKDVIESLIAECPPYAQDTQYYICGPGSMNRDVRSALMGLDVPSNRIHSESYGGDTDSDDSVEGVAAQAQMVLGGESQKVDINLGETLLKAALRAGIEAPYSCESGVCGACRAKLSQGQVHMKARMALDDGEVAAGHILACQSVALTDSLALKFEEA